MMKNAATAMINPPRIPPRTPPAMAPALVELDSVFFCC